MVEAVRAGRRRGQHRLRVWRTARSQASLRNPTLASYQTLGSHRPAGLSGSCRRLCGTSGHERLMRLGSTAGAAAQESLWL